MANRGTPAARPEIDSLIVTGATLAGVAAVIGLTGLAAGIAVLLQYFRRWMRHADVPPSEVAQQKWAQARAAATAGLDAWRKTEPQFSGHSHD